MKGTVEMINDKKKLLMVEDEPIMQKVHRLMLERMGYQVDLARNGEEALALSCGEYAVILMDVRLPDISGIAVTEKIRCREKGSRHTPIIGITAFVQEDIRDECRQAGMDDVVTKPVSISELCDLINRMSS